VASRPLSALPAATLLVAVLAVGVCDGSRRHEAQPLPAGVPWRAQALPGAGQIQLLAEAGGAVVAVVASGGAARQSRLLVLEQGRWRSVETVDRSFYGGRGAFVSVAGGPAAPADLVALRSASGGAHGNPRYTGWVGDVRRVAEVPATFETFGSPSALGPVDVATGENGPVLVGSWVTNGLASAAWWTLTDGTWRRSVGGPNMTSSSSRLLALTSVQARRDGYLVTGVATVLGHGEVRFQPVAWTGSPGRWRAVDLGADGGDGRAEAAACSSRQCLVLGSDEGGVLAWRLDGTHARSAGRPIDRPLAERGLLAGVVWPALRVVAAQTVDGLRLAVGGAGRWRAVRPPAVELVGLAMTDDAVLVVARAGGVCSLWAVSTADLTKVVGTERPAP
jgi:hypothetical protein